MRGYIGVGMKQMELEGFFGINWSMEFKRSWRVSMIFIMKVVMKEKKLNR